MTKHLASIKRVADEHQTIRRHLRLAGDSVPDKQALAVLEKAQVELAPDQTGLPPEKMEAIQQALSALDDGLVNHFHHEEESLSPLLGDLLMQALVLEHQEIAGAISKARQILAGIQKGELNQRERLARELDLYQTIDDIRLMVDDHASREETILDMVHRVLRETD
jgi:hypothetical protein